MGCLNKIIHSEIFSFKQKQTALLCYILRVYGTSINHFSPKANATASDMDVSNMLGAISPRTLPI